MAPKANFSGQLRLLRDACTEKEERRAVAATIKQVENLRGEERVGTVVECEVDAAAFAMLYWFQDCRACPLGESSTGAAEPPDPTPRNVSVNDRHAVILAGRARAGRAMSRSRVRA